MNYEKHIATAAKAYCEAKNKHELHVTNETRLVLFFAFHKLLYMMDAERFGWNPENFEDPILKGIKA